MGPEFVQRVAPELALRGRFTEAQAGLTGPENMYDSRGNPLNWVQNEGGVRQFYVPEGEQAYAERADEELNVPFPTQRRSPTEELAPNAGLTVQGRVPFASDRTYTGAPTPSSTARFNMGTSAGNLPRGNVAVPPAAAAPTAPRATNGQRFQTMNSPIQNAPADMLQMQRDNMRSDRITPRQAGENGGPQPNAAALRTANESGGTLASLLSRLSINIPQLRLNNAGTGEASAATDLRGLSAPEVQPTGNARAINNFDNDGLPRFDTPEMVAEFNAATGFHLRPNQGRTAGRQLELQAAGQTQHDYSYHIPRSDGTVLAGDVPSVDLGGRTHAAAEEFVRNTLQAAGYPVNNMDIVYKSGHGRNQGTGEHVHIEPSARYSRR